MASSDAEIVNCRNFIMTYIINGASTKMPFKQKDIMILLNKKDGLFKVGFEQAVKCLKDSYGIIVSAVPKSKTGKWYICYNEETTKILPLLNKAQQGHMILLFIILAYIFMRTTPSSQSIAEEQIENILRDLGIHFDRDHDFFGKNIKKLISETFVKQLYLERTRCPNELQTETKFQYSWGYRAHMEFDKKLLLHTIAKMLNKSPLTFLSKHKEVSGDEESPSTHS